MKLDKEMIESIIAQAQMTATYHKELRAQGFTHKDAMLMANAYMEAQIKAYTLAGLEQQKLELLSRGNMPKM